MTLDRESNEFGTSTQTFVSARSPHVVRPCVTARENRGLLRSEITFKVHVTRMGTVIDAEAERLQNRQRPRAV